MATRKPESAIPWKVCDDNPCKIVGDSKCGGIVAETSSWWASTEGAKANAAFIVDACNSHSELVAVVENLLSDIDALKRREDLEQAVNSSGSWFSVIRARKLIE